MTVLILADHTGKAVSRATLSAVTAALQISNEVEIALFGHNCVEAAQHAAGIQGVACVRVADAAHLAWPLAEIVAPAIAAIGRNYTHILAAATSTGKDILPRAAALLGSPQISDVTKIIAADMYQHPVYAGNALETVQSLSPLTLLTIRPTAFTPAATGGSARVEALPIPAENGRTRFIKMEGSASTRPELGSTRVVVSGGRGVGSAENFKLLEELADVLGASIGASRAAVDAGYVPNDWQVGQTGKVVAPDLYIAIGISGAIQHVAGMKDSKVIVAINRDENAPIFEIADYGLVADLFTALPELVTALRS